MKKSIKQLGEIAEQKLTEAVAFVREQLKSDAPDKATADKHIFGAQRSAKSFERAYFYGGMTGDLEKLKAHTAQFEEVNRTNLVDRVKALHDELNEILKPFADKVGAVIRNAKGEIV